MLSQSLLFVSLLACIARGLVIEQRATARTTSPSGCLVVQGTGTATGQYATFASAVAALGSTTTSKCIFMYPGTYQEQVRVTYGGNLTVYGYTSDVSGYANNQVTISSSQSSSQAGTLDASSAVNFANAGLKVYNINFANSYGTGAQAVAMTANGNHQGFYGCQFLGNQDTLYAKSGHQYYKRCYIEGKACTTDFVFGDAAAWFGVCTIGAKKTGAVITANSRTLDTDTTWYVFDTCNIGAAPSVTTSLAGTVYLGRPWRVLARVIFQNSVLSNVIATKGWTTLAADATPIFEEFNNSGAGSSTAGRVYETVATAAVSKKQLWNEDYNSWIDAAY